MFSRQNRQDVGAVGAAIVGVKHSVWDECPVKIPHFQSIDCVAVVPKFNEPLVVERGVFSARHSIAAQQFDQLLVAIYFVK